MKTVNVHEAKTHLSRLLDEAAAGEEIVIAKAGRPWARLVPVGTPAPRELGFAAGWTVSDAEMFDALPAGELAAWEPAPEP